jgi:predicted nucleic acid-binding protein
LKSKPIYVLDATPIIHLARVGKLTLIKDICDAYITTKVYRETTQNINYPDSFIIKDQIESGNIKLIENLDPRQLAALTRHPGIHPGEAETIVAAKELGGVAVLDDAEARALAKVHGIKYAPGTLFLLFRFLSLKLLTVDETEKTLNDLITSGLYLDLKTYHRAIEKIDEYRESDPSHANH